MPGAFFAAEVLEATAAIDEIMAEPFVLTPMKAAADRNAPAVLDGSRAEATFNAIFFDPEAKPMMPNAYDVREWRRPGVESGHPRVSVSPAEIAAQTCANGAPFAILPSDLMTRCSDGKIWKAATPFQAKSGKLVIPVNLVG